MSAGQLVVLAELVRQPGVRVAGDVRVGDPREVLDVRAASRAAPSEQFTPTISGSACSTDAQNASTVWPERLRPLWSIAVKEIQRGTSGATSSAAAIAAFAFSVSKTVSIRSRSTPPSTSAAICSAYASRTSSNVADAEAGSSTFGETESETFSGPTDAGDEAAGLVAPPRAREPRALEAHLGGVLLERVVGLADRVAVKVFVVAMSAPAAK